MIRKFIRSRNLSGYVIVNSDSRVLGYTYFVVDYPVAYLGDLYVKHRSVARAPYERLLDAVVKHLTDERAIERIESQAFDFNYDFSVLFRKHGFRIVKRYFLEKRLTEPLPSDACMRERAPFRIIAWHDRYLVPASEVIYDGYVDTPDSDLCHDYSSMHGCLRFLRNILENPGCGDFSRRETLLAVDGSGKLAGLLLATRTRSDTGMIPQISVRRDLQGKGIGSHMMREYLRLARLHGLAQVTLSVSGQNEAAFRLYKRLGFGVRRPFHAFIWTR
jgi:GNAT superfamily N-acetyltransferase